MALNNSVLGQPVAAADVNVNVDVANRRVAVDVQSTQNTYFARALGVQTANVGVEAVAEAARNSTGTAARSHGFSSAAEKPAAAVLLDQHCVSAVCVLSLSS